MYLYEKEDIERQRERNQGLTKKPGSYDVLEMTTKFLFDNSLFPLKILTPF